jgi:putative transposase
MPHRRPPRLHPESYCGAARVFLTFCTFERRSYFTSESIVSDIRGELLRTAETHHVAMIAYCFMPDHLHALVEGCCEDADIAKSVARFRQSSGYGYRRRCGARLWQEGYYDHVLRKEDDTLEVARYIIANPVRAGLCNDARRYRHLGSSRYSLDELVGSLA